MGNSSSDETMAYLPPRDVRSSKIIKPYRQFTRHSGSFDHNLLNRAKPMVTRSQSRVIRKIFPFLALPGELRMMIYEYCIDVTAAQNLIEKYYHLIDRELAQNPTSTLQDVEAPLIYSSVPAIFLINRQIYSEASSLINRRDLTFTHGMLDLLDIVDFIRAPLIQTVSSITINDSGHALFQANILTASWLGQMQLIKQLCEILAKGHQLKQLTIALTDQGLLPHITNCWNAPYACGFRDTLRETVLSMRKVHDVPSVTLIGFPEPLAGELKKLMQEPAKGFLTLPAELRNQIYSLSADWSDITPALNRTLANWVDKSKSPTYLPRSTPTILLLNKQITSEALAVLREKPLTIVYPAQHGLTKQQQVPNVLKLITKHSLRHVRHLVLNVESWEWIYSVALLLPYFASAQISTAVTKSTLPIPPTSPTTSTTNHLSALNLTSAPSAATVALQSFHLTYLDTLRTKFLRIAEHHYPDATIHRILSKLQDIRGLTKVSITGDLPAEYTEPMMQIMRLPAYASVTGMPMPRALKGDGRVVDFATEELDQDGDVVMSG